MATVTYNKLVIDCTDKGDVKGILTTSAGQQIVLGKEEINAKLVLMAAGGAVKDLATNGKVEMTDAAKKKYEYDSSGYVIERKRVKTIVRNVKANWKKVVALMLTGCTLFVGGMHVQKFWLSEKPELDDDYSNNQPAVEENVGDLIEEPYLAYDTANGEYFSNNGETEAYDSPRIK